MKTRPMVLKDLNLAHLTGTATIHKIGLFSQIIELNRPRRSIGQMFFKPYESKKEFIFCAQRTFIPLLQLGIMIFCPLAAVFVGAVYAAIILMALLQSAILKCIGDQTSAALSLGFAETFFAGFCQNMLDIMVVPVATLMFATRGISTGLKASGLYDYDAPRAEPQHEQTQDEMPKPSFV